MAESVDDIDRPERSEVDRVRLRANIPNKSWRSWNDALKHIAISSPRNIVTGLFYNEIEGKYHEDESTTGNTRHELATKFLIANALTAIHTDMPEAQFQGHKASLTDDVFFN